MTVNQGTSGEGIRPTTSGGVDNMGGGDTFTPGKEKPPELSTPQPAEKMAEKKQHSGSSNASNPSPGKSADK